MYLYPRNGIQWTTGDASGGNNGFGGVPAQVGFNAGDGVRFSTISSSRTNDVVNIDEKSNVMKPGIFVYEVDGTIVSGGCSKDAGIYIQTHECMVGATKVLYSGLTTYLSGP